MTILCGPGSVPLTCLVPASGKPPLERASIFTVVYTKQMLRTRLVHFSRFSRVRTGRPDSHQTPTARACPSQLV